MFASSKNPVAHKYAGLLKCRAKPYRMYLNEVQK